MKAATSHWWSSTHRGLPQRCDSLRAAPFSVQENACFPFSGFLSLCRQTRRRFSWNTRPHSVRWIAEASRLKSEIRLIGGPVSSLYVSSIEEALIDRDSVWARRCKLLHLGPWAGNEICAAGDHCRIVLIILTAAGKKTSWRINIHTHTPISPLCAYIKQICHIKKKERLIESLIPASTTSPLLLPQPIKCRPKIYFKWLSITIVFFTSQLVILAGTRGLSFAARLNLAVFSTTAGVEFCVSNRNWPLSARECDHNTASWCSKSLYGNSTTEDSIPPSFIQPVQKFKAVCRPEFFWPIYLIKP